MTAARRDSDRWITPAVVVVLLLSATLIVLGVVAAVTFLAYVGVDPSPMLDTVREVGTLVAAVGALVLQLTNRVTTTKVERNTGRLEAAVVETLDELDARTGRHTSPPPAEAVTEYSPPMLPPVPDVTRPHPFRGHSAAPVSGRSE